MVLLAPQLANHEQEMDSLREENQVLKTKLAAKQQVIQNNITLSSEALQLLLQGCAHPCIAFHQLSS